MIRGIAAYHLVTRRFATGYGHAAGELQTFLDGFRTTGDKKCTLQSRTGHRGQVLVELGAAAILKITGVGETDTLGLLFHSRQHSLIAMADIDGDRPRGDVDITPPRLVPQV